MYARESAFQTTIMFWTRHTLKNMVRRILKMFDHTLMHQNCHKIPPCSVERASFSPIGLPGHLWRNIHRHLLYLKTSRSPQLSNILTSGGPLSALTCCVNVRLLSGDKKNIAVNLFSKLGWELGLYQGRSHGCARVCRCHPQWQLAHLKTDAELLFF